MIILRVDEEMKWLSTVDEEASLAERFVDMFRNRPDFS